MPAKRRVAKRRTQYPEPIRLLLAGAPIEETEENRQSMIEIVYFGDWPDLPDETRDRAGEVLAEWREARDVRSEWRR